MKFHSFAISILSLQSQRKVSETFSDMLLAIKWSKICACFIAVLEASQPDKKNLDNLLLRRFSLEQSVVMQCTYSVCALAIKCIITPVVFYPLLFFITTFPQVISSALIYNHSKNNKASILYQATFRVFYRTLTEFYIILTACQILP